MFITNSDGFSRNTFYALNTMFTFEMNHVRKKDQ